MVSDSVNASSEHFSRLRPGGLAGSPKAGVAGSNPAGGTIIYAAQSIFSSRRIGRVPSTCHPHPPALTIRRSMDRPSGRAVMTTASPSLHETAIVSLTLPAALAVRDGHVARQRAANASCSLWLRTLASNAGPAKTLVGSGKRPTQTTARRLRYGVARTNTSDFSAPRGSHHCGDMWIHRIGCGAEEQAARTRGCWWCALRPPRARVACGHGAVSPDMC